VLNGDSSIAPTGAGDTTLSGVISGAGKLVKTSDKALILTNSNTYTGNTEIRRGGLILDSATGPAIHKDGGNLVFRSDLGSTAGIIKINRDEQMGDGAEIQFLYTGSSVGYQAVNLQGHTETVKGLTKSTTKLDSAYIQNEGPAFEGSTGKLIVDTAGSDYSFNGVIRDGSDLTVGTLSLDKKGLGTQALAGPCTYTGPTSVQGGTLAVNGSITSAVEVQAAGTLRGAGTITGNVDVNGTLGAFYNGDTDTADLLTVVGQLDLTGSTISLSNAGAGTLGEGDYVLATYSSLVGLPTTEVGLLEDWDLDYGVKVANSIVLIVPKPAPVPGDANDDGKVNDVDATTVAQNWGSSGDEIGWAQGDFNDDNVVNAADASIMAANWHYGVSEGASVPEPSAIVLLAAGLALLAIRRER
jgi:autotransporter-associated beta strand protein